MANHPSSSADPIIPNIPVDFSASMTKNQPHDHTLPNNLGENLHNHTLPNNLGENLPNTFLNPFENTRPIDPSSPLFLHNGDNLGILLIPQPLIGENCSTCSHSMLVALSAKNKMCFIDSSLPEP